MTQGRLDGQVAIITGAGSGIGAASAPRCVEEGAKVLIADMTEKKAAPLADELGDAGAFFQPDASREDDVETMVGEAVRSRYVTGHAQVVDGGAFAGKPWNKQHANMTHARPIKMYRPDGR